jgi:hypothetical protein
MKILFLVAILTALLSGCASSLGKLNRRPFMNDVSFVGFTSKNLDSGKSMGKQEFEKCNSRWGIFGIKLGTEPTFAELKKEEIESKPIRYMTNVTSNEWGETGFLRGKSCISIEGEVFQ